MNTKQSAFYKPVIILFVIINIIAIVFANWLDTKNIDHVVIMIANLILFILSVITGAIHIKALGTNNPHAFVRSVTASSFLKLMVIAISVVIYLVAIKENRSYYAVIASMALYILYTIFEVSGAMKMNKIQNAENRTSA